MANKITYEMPTQYSRDLLKKYTHFSIMHYQTGTHVLFKNNQIISDNKKVMYNMDYLYDQCMAFSQACGGTSSEPIVIDGTLIGEYNQDDPMAVKLIKTYDAIKHCKEDKKLKFVINDVVTWHEYDKDVGRKFFERQQWFTKIYNSIAYEIPDVILNEPLYTGCNYSKIEELHDQLMVDNFDGILIHTNDRYHKARTRHLMLYRKTFTDDFKIIDFVPGTGRNRSILGALKLDCNGREISVHDGLNKDDKEYIWRHRAELLGTYVTVRYHLESTGGKNFAPKVQFPIFVTLKENEDYDRYKAEKAKRPRRTTTKVHGWKCSV